jgi:hypothetical protein
MAGRTIGTQSGAQATREAELHLKALELTHIPRACQKKFCNFAEMRARQPRRFPARKPRRFNPPSQELSTEYRLQAFRFEIFDILRCKRPAACPLCSECVRDFGTATEASSLERDRCPNEAAGFSRLRRIDRLCHHASLLSRKLQRRPRRIKPPQLWAGILSRATSPPRRYARFCSPAPRRPPAAAAADAARSPTDRLWLPSIAADWRLPH